MPLKTSPTGSELFIVDNLAALLGRAWVERDQAMRAFALWLAFKRTGSAIAEATRSLINGLLRENRLKAAGVRIRRAR